MTRHIVTDVVKLDTSKRTERDAWSSILSYILREMSVEVQSRGKMSDQRTTRKYSKPLGGYAERKVLFFEDNVKLLELKIKQNNAYRDQPLRTNCKICLYSLPKSPDVTQHGVQYAFCGRCGHLNGFHEDTEKFARLLYSTDGGEEYAANYVGGDFLGRTLEVYMPKFDFMMEAIPQKDLTVLDIGCGSGHFVHAALLRKTKASGIDVSKFAVEHGNKEINDSLEGPLTCVGDQELYQEVIDSTAEIISAVGVIEHLTNPQLFFDAFKESRAQYIFYSVPMFSLSAVLENVFEGVFPRQLSGGHTHLFTESSISVLNSSLGIRPLAEWRFGTDIMDLYRSLVISLGATDSSVVAKDVLWRGLGPSLDELQSVLDKSHFCSEIHVVGIKS